MLKHKLKQKNILVEKKLDPNLPQLPAYAGELNQIWTNLIVNAVDAMDHGGQLTIETYQERRNLMVAISDTGQGIPEEILTQIFDPFFTTKAMGEGTGLGLDIVRRIVGRHRGEIDVTSRPGKTTFTLCFPLATYKQPA